MTRALLLLTLLPALAAAQGVAVSRGHDSNAPIDVTSDHIELQDKANRAIFTGKVHVVQGDMTMDAARMNVAYTKPPPGKPGDPQIQRIDASGGVLVNGPNQRARGSFGIYDLDRRIVTLIGGVSLTRNGNTVNGARLVMDLDSGRSTVDGSAVGGGAPGTVQSAGGRVTGRFTAPPKSQAPTPATPPAAPPAPK